MSNKNIIIESKDLWDRYFSDAKRESQYDEEFKKFLDDIRRKEEEKAQNLLQPWLHIYEDCIQWLVNIWGILSRMVDEGEGENALLLSAWSLISSSCNHAISVRLLVKSGLDNPARGAVRALDEHLCACIAILNQPDLANGFHGCQNDEDSSRFWYDNFNTKKLRKHLNAVERSLGVEQHVSWEFREWRENELNYFSQTIHPTFLSGVLATRAVDVEDPNLMVPAVFGCLTAASERTLKHACKSLWYFSCFGFLLLFNEHAGKKPLITLDKEDEMHQMAVVGRKVVQELNFKYWEFTKYPEFKDT